MSISGIHTSSGVHYTCPDYDQKNFYAIEAFKNFLQKIELNQKASFSYYENSRHHCIEFGVKNEGEFASDEIVGKYVGEPLLCGRTRYDKNIYTVETILYSPEEITESYYSTEDSNRVQESANRIKEVINSSSGTPLSYIFLTKTTLDRLLHSPSDDFIEIQMKNLAEQRILELQNNVLSS
jgi:hypothetical protein